MRGRVYTFDNGYTHTRINDNSKKVLGSASFLYALIELMNEKGFISIP